MCDGEKVRHAWIYGGMCAIRPPVYTFGLCRASFSIYCSRPPGLRLGLRRRLLQRGVCVIPSQAVNTVCFTMYSGGNLEANNVQLSAACGLSQTRRGCHCRLSRPTISVRFPRSDERSMVAQPFLGTPRMRSVVRLLDWSTPCTLPPRLSVAGCARRNPPGARCSGTRSSQRRCQPLPTNFSLPDGLSAASLAASYDMRVRGSLASNITFKSKSRPVLMPVLIVWTKVSFVFRLDLVHSDSSSRSAVGQQMRSLNCAELPVAFHDQGV
jgi:hypothetical protein